MSDHHSEPSGKPIGALPCTSDLAVVWILRVLVRLEGLHAITPHSDGPPQYDALRICAALRMPVPRQCDPEAQMGLARSLSASLEALERRPRALRLPATLATNLNKLQRLLGLSLIEVRLLAAAILMVTHDGLRRAVSHAPTGVDPHSELATLVGSSARKVARALGAGGRLRRSGLLAMGESSNLCDFLRLAHPQLRRLSSVRLSNVSEFVQALVEPLPAPTLNAAHFTHLTPGFDAIARFLDACTKERIRGANVLFHGAPGTGKTELCRALARATKARAYQVSTRTEDGRALAPKDRLARLATGQFLLGREGGLICFDEADALFEIGSSGQGMASVADAQKAWLNELLETAAVPILWVANRIDGIDPAFVRRCDLAIHVDTPPRSQRLAWMREECTELVSETTLEALASCDHLAPAVIARSIRTVRRMRRGKTEVDARHLEAVLDGVLQAQGHPSLRATLARHRGSEFDPAYCNTSESLEAVLAAVQRSGHGRLCLHGPPGTGKTAFGRWMAERLGKDWLPKRASDLLSPWSGQTEKNLSRAFEQAQRQQAVLQLDEVDSFLRDRGHARYGWEVTEVNEFLTQLECFDGVVVTTTNRIEALDHAAARRFDWVIEFRCLRKEQSLEMLRRLALATGLAAGVHLDRQSIHIPDQLTPADFDAMQRRHQMGPFPDVSALLLALQERVASRPRQGRTVGFL